jgi:hypothetical protein
MLRFHPVLVLGSVSLALLSGASAQEILQFHTGAPGAALGAVATAGDLDGDGHVELIAGAPLDASSRGRVTVTSGASGEVLFSAQGDGPGDLFGWSVASAGDVDGDGVSDVIAGAPGTGAALGYARVFSGVDGSVLHTLSGATPGGRFGTAVTTSGDLDGDGLDDLAVGAPGDDAGGLDAGAVHFFGGGSGDEFHSLNGSGTGDELGATLDGFSDNDSSGVIGVSDNDSSGVIGIVAGAPQTGGGGGSGYVLVVSPGLSLPLQVDGLQPGDRFGASLRLVGDVNGDGVSDLLAGGDPRDGSGQPSRPGYARLISGADGLTIHTFTDGQLGWGYGTAVAAAGDVDGDGINDVIVGEPGSDAGGADRGRLYVYSGSDGAVLHVLNGPEAGGQFGAAIAYAGDVNGDALADFAASAPFHASGSGAVVVMSTSPWDDVADGTAGQYGIPRLDPQGGMVAETQVSLTLSSAREDTTATLVIGESLFVDVANGLLSPMPEQVVAGLGTAGDGTLDYTFTWPEEIPSGTKLYYQFAVTDPDAPGGVAYSNTVAGVTP